MSYRLTAVHRAIYNADRRTFSLLPQLPIVLLTVLVSQHCVAQHSVTQPAVGSTQQEEGNQTTRPVRQQLHLSLTVGQDDGDLQGSDDKIIQSGIDYLSRLGGGTLNILPGVYELHNAIYLRPNIVLRGTGQETILKKARSVASKISQDSDWFEYAVHVHDASGFAPGAGVMLRSKTGAGDWQYDVLRATLTAVQGNVVYLDRMTNKNFWLDADASLATIYPLLTAENVDDVVVEDLVLEGNRGENEHINGNFSGGVFIQQCNRWLFKNVVARNYNGDGFSFQVCDDIEFESCKAIRNADLGFHPGSGSQRPVFRNCTSRENSLGIFFCWSVCDGVVQDCVLSNNHRYGISIGHRDTDNVVRRSTIERNGEVGILFRAEANNFRSGNRNRIEDCVIRDNGTRSAGVGVEIRGKTSDIAISNTRFKNAESDTQGIGIRIGAEAEHINLHRNSFESGALGIEDLRSDGTKESP